MDISFRNVGSFLITVLLRSALPKGSRATITLEKNWFLKATHRTRPFRLLNPAAHPLYQAHYIPLHIQELPEPGQDACARSGDKENQRALSRSGRRSQAPAGNDGTVQPCRCGGLAAHGNADVNDVHRGHKQTEQTHMVAIERYAERQGENGRECKETPQEKWFHGPS